MATVYWWVVPVAEANAAVRPADARIISTPDSGPEYAALVAGGSYGGAARFQGPFTSQGTAQAAPASGGNAIGVALAGIGAGLQSVPGAGGNLLSQSPWTSITDVFQALQKGAAWIGNRQNWVRIAEVIMGVALVIVAVNELGKGTPLGKLAGKVPVIT